MDWNLYTFLVPCWVFQKQKFEAKFFSVNTNNIFSYHNKKRAEFLPWQWIWWTRSSSECRTRSRARHSRSPWAKRAAQSRSRAECSNFSLRAAFEAVVERGEQNSAPYYCLVLWRRSLCALLSWRALRCRSRRRDPSARRRIALSWPNSADRCESPRPEWSHTWASTAKGDTRRRLARAACVRHQQTWTSTSMMMPLYVCRLPRATFYLREVCTKRELQTSNTAERCAHSRPILCTHIKATRCRIDSRWETSAFFSFWFTLI